MDNLHFAGREVPRYAEHAAAMTLIEGKVYFQVHFLDRELTIPELTPLVFIGRNLGAGR
jgi:hypothetical protein